jgi:HEAT repeat protein
VKYSAFGVLVLAFATAAAQDSPRPPAPTKTPATPRRATPAPRPPRPVEPDLWHLMEPRLAPLPPMGELPMPGWPEISPAPFVSPGFDLHAPGFADLRFDFDWESKQLEIEHRFQEKQLEFEHLFMDREHELNLAQADWEHALGRSNPRPAIAPFESSWTTPPGRAPFATNPPAARRLEDQADSLYKSAREMLNRGEYRRAASMFSDLSTKHPNSVYAADALYWNAYALYRIGGTQELRGALDALQAQQTKYPNARTAQADGRTLATRIRGALAARGDATAAAQLRGTASDSALRCDREEQSVRVEALKAVIESDPESAMPLIQRTLSRTDDCSASLRQTAVFMVGSKERTGQGVALLSQVARNDPSVQVRQSALQWLARMPGDEALTTIESLSRDSTNKELQSYAIRALVSHPSERARTLVRSVVERNDVPERLRIEALSAFSKERSNADDVAWLRTLYGRSDNPRIKSRVVSALTRIGGSEVDSWLLSIARDPEADSETRSYAMRRIAETQPIAELAKLYDAAAQRSVRETIISALERRSEAEATDKLIDIVKNGTDPNLRTRAISALTRKKDPRTNALLMELISK